MEEKILKAIGELKNQMDEKLSAIGNRMNNIEEQQKESIAILKALEHAAQVNKAEHDSMQHDIAEIKGDIKSIKDDLATVEKVTIKNWNDISNLKAAR